MVNDKINIEYLKAFTVSLYILDFSIEPISLRFPPGEGPQEQCTDVTIVSDGLLEDEETYCVSLDSSDPDITIGMVSVTCITIQDVDTVVVNWEQLEYSTTENSILRVCAVQSNETERSFTVNIGAPIGLG